MSPTRVSGRLLLDGAFVPGSLVLEGDRIGSIETSVAAAPDAADPLPLVAPGAIDLHVHGYAGADPTDDLAAMARGLARVGTTAFLPTLFPRAPAELGRELERLAPGLGPVDGGAEALGFHLEGPFLNREAAGALPAETFAEPSAEALRAVLGPATGGGRGVRAMTVAPELPGAADLVEELARAGVRASLGHSLATAAEARAATRRGAAGATHLFNAMRPWHHREVGLAGFALTDDALTAEVIGDLTHVSAEALTLALEARGALGLCLVSDALPGAGTGCEVFHFRGRPHVVRRGAAYYGDGATPAEEAPLAGSATSQLDALRGLVRAGVVGLEEGLAMLAESPARALGLERERGVLAEGARADLIVLDPADLALRETWVGGRRVAAPGG